MKNRIFERFCDPNTERDIEDLLKIIENLKEKIRQNIEDFQPEDFKVVLTSRFFDKLCKNLGKVAEEKYQKRKQYLKRRGARR